MSFAVGKSFKSITPGICWLYTGAVVGFLILRAGLPELPPSLALVNSLAPLLFLPVPVVLFLAIGLRAKGVLLAGAIPLIPFASLYGALFLPHPGRSDCAAHQALRVMTFNLGAHLGQPEALIDLVADQKADLVALQEMTSEIAQTFEQEFSAVYPYRVSRPGETTGLFSRHPILEQEWIAPTGGGRSYIRAVVEWKDETVEIFVVHPLPPGLEWYRDTAIPVGLHDAGPQKQIQEIRRRAAAEDGPVLIVGDFNMSDQSRGYTGMAEAFVDAYRAGGWGFGFTFPKGLQIGRIPLPGPFIRMDYIFHSDAFCTDWARVGCGGGSDHCYVLAQLARRGS
jgi:vancomycin resistance protein VanJ